MFDKKEMEFEDLEKVSGGRLEQEAIDWYNKNLTKIQEQATANSDWLLLGDLFSIGLDDELHTLDDLKTILEQHNIDISDFEN